MPALTLSPSLTFKFAPYGTLKSVFDPLPLVTIVIFECLTIQRVTGKPNSSFATAVSRLSENFTVPAF